MIYLTGSYRYKDTDESDARVGSRYPLPGFDDGTPDVFDEWTRHVRHVRNTITADLRRACGDPTLTHDEITWRLMELPDPDLSPPADVEGASPPVVP